MFFISLELKINQILLDGRGDARLGGDQIDVKWDIRTIVSFKI